MWAVPVKMMDVILVIRLLYCKGEGTSADVIKVPTQVTLN